MCIDFQPSRLYFEDILKMKSSDIRLLQIQIRGFTHNRIIQNFL